MFQNFFAINKPDIGQNLEWPNSSFNNHVSKCNIMIYKNAEDKCIIIATELDENTGKSVTNVAEELWKFVLYKYKLKIENCTFIECYQNNTRDDAYSIVNVYYDSNGTRVAWAPINNINQYMNSFLNVATLPKSRLEGIE